MENYLHEKFVAWQTDVEKAGSDRVVAMIDAILRGAVALAASDVHFQPGRNGVEIRFRIDGVLHVLGRMPLENSPQIAARLKVFAGLLTYRTDTPQEGRVRSDRIEGVNREMRISTAPSLYGERVVVRFFSEESRCQYIDSLGFSREIEEQLKQALQRRSGAVLIVGPAGSGKTTTAYAMLRELARPAGPVRSIVSLEDPIEHAIDGVAQIEIAPNDATSGTKSMTLDRMLQYMMRQDPEILMVGEIRERKTAEAAFQAALTGHLLISTFHAGSAVEAVGRFLELKIEPFVLRSSIAFVLCQRLLRKLCSCAEWVENPLEICLNGTKFTFKNYREARGCENCGGTGYAGRIPFAEILPLDNEEVVNALLNRQSTTTIQRLALQHGMVSLAENAASLITVGLTSPLEAKRVLGHAVSKFSDLAEFSHPS